MLHPSSASEITGFRVGDAVGEIDEASKTITVTVPAGTDVTKLVPRISIPVYATISPKSGIETDFTSPVVYTVTADDGVTTSQYTVTVTVES